MVLPNFMFKAQCEVKKNLYLVLSIKYCKKNLTLVGLSIGLASYSIVFYTFINNKLLYGFLQYTLMIFLPKIKHNAQ